jgi:hypothetical protein
VKTRAACIWASVACSKIILLPVDTPKTPGRFTLPKAAESR